MVLPPPYKPQAPNKPLLTTLTRNAISFASASSRNSLYVRSQAQYSGKQPWNPKLPNARQKAEFRYYLYVAAHVALALIDAALVAATQGNATTLRVDLMALKQKDKGKLDEGKM